MAEDIRQNIGIDVSQALAAVDSLDARLKGLGASLDALLGKMKPLGAQADKTAGAIGKRFVVGASRASKAVTQLGNQATGVRGRLAALGAGVKTAAADMAKLGTTVGNTVKQMSIGFQLLGRIVSTQLIIRGINSIISAFSEAVASASEFQLQISEVQTISKNAFGDFDQAAESVRRISDAFNLPLGEVGEGLYQVISNQIQGAANQISVLEASASLAKVGVADFSSTVELLTGTINAFGLEARDTEKLAAVFFETVRLGRTRIDALANSFGTVAPLFEEAGGEVEELAAAFATLTINGVETSKAATQLRGVVNAFLKPTEDMAEVLNKAGFASGEMAIEALGLEGALKLITEASGGSATEMAKLIPRVRGLAGALVLGRDGGKQLVSNLEDIRAASASLVQEKLEIRIETDAERVERQLNELSNALTVDLGQSALKAARYMLELTNAGDNVTIAVKALIPAVTVATGVLVVYGTAALAAAGKNAIAAASFGTLTIAAGSFVAIVGSIVAGYLAIQSAAEATSKNALEETIEGAKKTSAARVKQARELRNILLEEERKAIRERFALLSEAVRDERGILNRRFENWQETNDKIKQDTKTVLDGIVQANRSLVSNLGSEREAATNLALDADVRAADRRAALADDEFRFLNKRRSAIAQASAAEERGLSLARKASEALAAARSKEDVDAALRVQQRADGFLQEAAAAAETTGNLALQNRVAQARFSTQRALIAAEETQAQRQRQRAAELQRQQDQEAARLQSLSQEVKKVLDLQDELNVTDNFTDRSKITKQIQNSLGTIRKLALPEKAKLTANDIFSFAQFNKDISSALQTQRAAGIDLDATLSGASLQQLNTEIELGIADAVTKGINTALSQGIDREKLQEIEFGLGGTGTVDALVGFINEEKQRQIKVAENIAAQKEATEDLHNAAREMADIFENNSTIFGKLAQAINVPIAAALSGSNELLTGGAAGADLSLEEARNQIIALSQEASNITATAGTKTAGELASQLTQLDNDYQTLFAGLSIFQKQVLKTSIRNVEAQFQRSAQVLSELLQEGSLTTEQQAAGRLGIDTELKNATTEAANTTQATNQLNQAMGTVEQTTANTSQQLSVMHQQVTAIGQAAAQIQFPSVPSPQAVTAQIGRNVRARYLSGGGFVSKGTDTVPAMLTPGEVVMNPRASRKWYTQLQAMNAGVQPIYRQEGGPVSNSNFGDINVTVNTSTSRVDDRAGRQLGRALKRELRRNTLSLS